MRDTLDAIRSMGGHLSKAVPENKSGGLVVLLLFISSLAIVLFVTRHLWMDKVSFLKKKKSTQKEADSQEKFTHDGIEYHTDSSGVIRDRANRPFKWEERSNEFGGSKKILFQDGTQMIQDKKDGVEYFDDVNGPKEGIHTNLGSRARI